jgi:hypothetical protein
MMKVTELAVNQRLTSHEFGIWNSSSILSMTPDTAFFTIEAAQGGPRRLYLIDQENLEVCVAFGAARTPIEGNNKEAVRLG